MSADCCLQVTLRGKCKVDNGIFDNYIVDNFKVDNYIVENFKVDNYIVDNFKVDNYILDNCTVYFTQLTIDQFRIE